jgi:hypothetical protein
MTTVTAEALEESWGDEGNAGDSVGKPLKDVPNDGALRAFVDLVVHPARATDFIQAFDTNHNKKALEEAKGELLEVLEHLKKATSEN